MTTEYIDDAHVFPEDRGTDAPSDYSQPDSAGFFGALIRHEALLDYVSSGLDLYLDSGTNTLDISSGLVHVLVDETVDVQTTPGGDHDSTLEAGIGVVVGVPGHEGLSLSSGSLNHVFLGVDMSEGDGAYYRANTTDERPDDPHVKIGTVDTGSGDVEPLNRSPSLGGDGDTEALESRVEDLEAAVDDLEIDVSDLDSDLTNLESDHADLESRVTALENDVADLQDRGQPFVVDSGGSPPSEADADDIVGYRE